MVDLDSDVGAYEADVLQEGIVLLADPGLLVVAGDVVPVDAVVVELVENGQAVLGGAVLEGFSVVGLGFANTGKEKKVFYFCMAVF